MILSAMLLASATPSKAVSLAEASRALASGRLEQARSMAAAAIEQGAEGDDLQLLLADLDYADGRQSTALARYSLLASKLNTSALHEKAASAALLAGDLPAAHKHAERALTIDQNSARAWNIRGVVADLERDWAAADLAYLRALSLAPANAHIKNNRGWSLILQGRWEEALSLLEAAASEYPRSDRILANLDLVRMALDRRLPERGRAEAEAKWAARLNDAGVAAMLRGDKAKSKAALSRALEVRAEWFERASNNLQLIEVQE